MLVQSPVVCSVSVVGEVGERTPQAPRSGGGLITSPVVFSSVELSGTGVSRAANRKHVKTTIDTTQRH